MGRKKGISTHRKNAKKNQSIKLSVNPVRHKITTRSTKNGNMTIINDDNTTGSNETCTSNSNTIVNNNGNGQDLTEFPSSSKSSKLSRSTRESTEVGNHLSMRTKAMSTDELYVTPLSPNTNSKTGHCLLTSMNSNQIETPLESNRSDMTPTNQNDVNGKCRMMRNGNVNSTRKIFVRNTVNYRENNNHGKVCDRNNKRTPASNVLISNTINYNVNDESRIASPSTPVNNVLITNDINYNENSSSSSCESDGSSNDPSTNKENQFSSYSTRRRIIRKLKDSIKKIGSIYQQASILSELFNEADMQPVLRAGNILSPKEVLGNKLIVEQLLKQVHRCSHKRSTRGRINNDQDSLRTNLVAAMMCSPKDNNADEPIKKVDVLRMICSDDRISRSAGKRLINKAHKQRKKLSSQEKITSWSIIKSRHGYNTQQSNLNAALFDWIINHPHVVTSPIARDSVLVKVRSQDGRVIKERVGKLLLKISVRELHQDLIQPPPIGLSGVYWKDTKKLLISERYLRSMLPPQLRAMTFAQNKFVVANVAL